MACTLDSMNGVIAAMRIAVPSHGRYVIQPIAMTVSDSEMDREAHIRVTPRDTISRTMGSHDTVTEDLCYVIYCLYAKFHKSHSHDN